MCISLVLVSLLHMLSSCGGGGDSVLEKISKAMDELSSYEADGELNITAYCYNEKLNITGESKSIYSEEEDLYYYSKSDINIKHASFTTSTTFLEAYNEGEYLLTYAVGDEKTRLRSEHTEAEITEYFEDRSEFGSILSGYSNISTSKNERNGYDVKLWNYDKKTIRALNASYGFPLEKSGATITDISVTISTHSNYLINEINIDYVFSSDDFSGSEKTLYSNYEAAEKIVSGLSVRNYTAVSDARVVSTLMSRLTEKTISDEDSFKSEYKVKYSIMGVKEEITQEYDVSYAYTDNGYEFDVDKQAGDEKHHEKYEAGMYTLDGEDAEELSYYEARMYIDALMDPFSFTPAGITKIEKTEGEAGTVIYTLDIYVNQTPIYDVAKQTISSIGAKYLRTNAQMQIEFKGDELVSINYLIEPVGQIHIGGYNYLEISIDIEAKTTFE